MKKCIVVLIFSCTVAASTLAQDSFSRGKDSIKLRISNTKIDSIRVMEWMKYGWWWETYSLDSAAQCYLKMGELAKKINYVEGILKYYANYTFILNQKGNFQEGLKLNLESVEIDQQKGNHTQIANCLVNVGSSYLNMADNNNAIHYYLQAASIFEGSKLYRNLVITYNNIGGLFTNINDDEKAFDYYTRALTIARTQPMEETLATVLMDAGIGAMRLEKYTEAEMYLTEGIILSQKNGWNQLKIRGEITMSELLATLKQYQKAIEYAESGLSGARLLGSKYFEVEALGVLAEAYNTLKNAQNTIRYAELGVVIGKQNGIRHNFVKFYSVLSNAHAELGNFKDSYKYLKLSKQLEDSINQKEVTKKIEQLEISYQSAQKQQQISQLQRDQKSQQIFIGGLIFGIIILLLVGFSIYRNFLNRRKISEQKQELIENEYKQLKQKHQLVAAASILQGEEEERKRLAKDLHDGLGGLLTGVKISLSNIKGNMLLQQEDVFIFERALDMLDNSITELRRVAHNMMPEALVKFGLAIAIKDFCESINSMKALSIAFQVVGQPRRFASSQEIIIYRIVQELLNNALKHSNAEKALVQLSFELNEFSLTVEDNGRGFDKALIESSNTNGWKNIKSRVEYLKGSLDVSTTLEEGTSVHIRLML